MSDDFELWNPEYRVEVNTYGDPEGSWAGNAVRYDDKAAAIEAAKDLFFRWTAVEHWRVMDDMDNLIEEGP